MMLELNTIHCVDYRELLGGLDAGSVNLILSDLPYGVTACEWDTPIDLTVWWQEVKRVLAPRGAVVMTATQPFTTDLIVSNRKWFKHEWIWVKELGGGYVMAKTRPLSICESVLVFAEGDTDYFPQMTKGKFRNKSGSGGNVNFGIKKSSTGFNDDYYPKNVLYFSNASNSGKTHPTQKPVDLFRYLIRTYTNAGALVVDPFMGSGTTAVSAKIEGRNFIVGDTSAEYCEIARRRVNPTFGEPPKRLKPELPLSDLPMFRDVE